LLAFSLLWLVGFAIGFAKIGLTQWALVGRLLGWLVLLGYLAAGYLMVQSMGYKGLRRFIETLAIIATLIVGWQVALRLFVLAGYGDIGLLSPNFEGYSGNRNAFAFQLLSVMSLFLAFLCGEKIQTHNSLVPPKCGSRHDHGWLGLVRVARRHGCGRMRADSGSGNQGAFVAWAGTAGDLGGRALGWCGAYRESDRVESGRGKEPQRARRTIRGYQQS
jgi:hypothetical protein